MLNLHDVVRLRKPDDRFGIPTSYIGTVVDVLGAGSAYTVEFVDPEGNSIEDALFTEYLENELILVDERGSE